ncbi:OprD family outer membrane porin [Kosakonia sp. H02]|nr:OprD family outer membrane porin [Kosakonia sp. H02]
MSAIKFTLPLVFISGLSGTTAFANNELPNTQGFIENSQFDITLKNVWMLNTSNQHADAGIGEQRAWAQGALLDYQSGWYRDVIGVDASWYSVVKLYANDDFAGRDLLRDHNGHAEGFNKIGQLYGKLKWEDEHAYARLYAGWKQLYKFGAISVTRSRAAPSSWQGVSLESGWEDFSARAAWVTRFSERDEPEKRRFYTLKSNKPIDHIVTGDVSWIPAKNTRVTWLIGESDNYLLRQGLETQFSLPLAENENILLRGAWYYNRGLAEWEGARGFTNTAQHIFAMVSYQSQDIESGIAWSKTKAHLDNGLGHFYWHMGKNTRGAFNSPADGEGNDYVNDNEQMLYWYGKYALSPELTAGIFANHGFGAKYQGVALTQWEYGGFVAWAPAAISGLSISAGFGPSYSWKLVHGKPSLTEDKRAFHRSKGVGGGVTMEYKFGLHN